MISENDLNPNPVEQFANWYEQAFKVELASGAKEQNTFVFSVFKKVHESLQKILNYGSAFDPNAMTLATIDAQGHPQARIVLLKDFDDRGFCFYTNYNSPKAQQLDNHPHAALVFHWPFPGRQIRITGHIERLTDDENVKYWKSRLRMSQIGGWASHQSEVIPNRKFLEDRVHDLEKKYAGIEVPHPSHWGGYRLIPNKFEFWHSGLYRLHDRFIYTPVEKANINSTQTWKIERLSP